MTEIAEAYFHFRRVDLSPDQLQKLGDAASELSAVTAIGLFPPETIIDVRLEQGSLKGWVTLIGALTVYGHIADYKGFKESIAEIVSDGRAFSDAISRQVSSRKELEGSFIYRQERRTKTPGKIKRIIQKREWLDAHKFQLTKADIARLNYEIERLLQSALSDIEPGERASLRKILGEEEPHLPPSDAPRFALPPPRLEQGGMFEIDGDTEEQIGSDYHRRFRLSDGAILDNRDTYLLPFGMITTKRHP